MIEIKGIRFEVKIVHKAIRNLYLRLKDEEILATAPFLMPDFEVYRFIERKRDWIYKTHERMKQKQAASRIYDGSNVFFIYDTPYRLIRSLGKSSASIGDHTVFLSYRDDSEDAIRYLYKKTDRELLIKAECYLNKHLPFLRDYGYHLIPELRCRVMTSKWGVCYTKKNRITISSYLIHYPLECLEYIIVHEMTHFIVPNHSRRFYELLAGRMPDYKNAQKRLKE